MALYKIHSFGIYPDGAGAAVYLADVTSQSLDLATEMRAEVTAGNVSPTHVALVGRKLLQSAATYDLPGFLDSVGVSGLCITGATNFGARAFLQKFDGCGTGASSGHRSFTFANGIIVPKTLTVEHQGDAKLTFELHVLGDGGTNDPVILSDAATLPTITQTPNRWTLGPITLGGLSFAEYTGLEIDFGNDIQVKGVASNIDATHVEVRTHSPKIKIKGIDPVWFSSSKIPIGGLVAANATDKIFLRKRTQTGINFAANGTSGHIKIVPAGLAAIGKAGGAEMQRVSETEIMITCAKDASANNPIVITTATTIA